MGRSAYLGNARSKTTQEGFWILEFLMARDIVICEYHLKSDITLDSSLSREYEAVDSNQDLRARALQILATAKRLLELSGS
jgi:hypothetical protein